MKVTVFGSGYVGLVTGVCLADVGCDVVCVDVDEAKIALLKSGGLSIYEPGLDAIVKRNVDAGRLSFTTDIKTAVSHGVYQFIAVGTPPDEDGSADLQYVLAVAKSIAEYMDEYKVIIDKSTVPVGTADKVRMVINETLSHRQVDFDVVSNPEFLKEGSAINDFMKPDRIVIGVDSDRAKHLMHDIYAPFSRNHDRRIYMDIRSAELTKYAANSMLATKISFMNELANIAEEVGADIENVRIGMGSDPRIGYHFIYPGCGYGGSCFPKDVQALHKSAKEFGCESRILEAVEAVNFDQKRIIFKKIKTYYKGKLDGKTFALWGLAFKPNTDDMRDAPSRVLMEALWDAGAKVRAYDPEAKEEALRIYGDRDDLTLCESAYGALETADALIIVTEWKEFKNPNFEKIISELVSPVLFDGRNLYDPIDMQKNGIDYYAIGRGQKLD